MAEEYELNAEVRRDVGKGASRRLRRAKRVPAILYGGGGDPVPLTLDHDLLKNSLQNEAFFSRVLTINVDGKAEKAVLRDLQRHSDKPKILHADLQRVSASEKITMNVPLHFVGEDIAPGVKVGGGIVSHNMTNVEINCLAKNLPEFIEVDVSGLELNEAIHLSDLRLPDGVVFSGLAQSGDYDLPVVSIHMPRAAKEEEEEEAAAAEEAGIEAEEAPVEGAEGEAKE